jgi:thioredoxin-like negative regulator of GroEL
LEHLAEKNADSVRIIKVDAVKNREWSRQENVRGVPAFRLYSGGMLVDRFVGAYPENMLQEKIDKFATVFNGSSSQKNQKKGKGGGDAATRTEPTVRPMPKNWMPAGVTSE